MEPSYIYHCYTLSSSAYPEIQKYHKDPREGEGTGTRLDYLANGADQKIEGPLAKKIARKSRNSWRVSSGVVGAQGQLTRGVNWRKS